MVIKYGTATGVEGMNAGTLFNKTIRTYAPYDDNGGLPFKDTVIEVTPAATDVYYFGFHNLSIDSYDSSGGLPVIGNFSVSEENSSTKAPQYVLKGNTNNADNILSLTKINVQPESDVEVQRSSDGIHFAKIGTINNEKNGKINHPDFKKHFLNVSLWANLKGKPKPDYEKALYASTSLLKNKPTFNVSNLKINTASDYIDKNVQGTNYYRLKCADTNGDISYSNIVKLESLKTINIYPNPAKDILNINLNSINLSKATLQVTNVAGAILINKKIDALSKQNVLQLNVSQLIPGTYFIKIISADATRTSVDKFEKQ
ncbi:MAG TPA: T9SS type A sorting domain-containing protein [Parafilimonas sp.]|nr:T9SS type A sorting domain-containing protein [Parafilimonas sp.]